MFQVLAHANEIEIAIESAIMIAIENVIVIGTKIEEIVANRVIIKRVHHQQRRLIKNKETKKGSSRLCGKNIS